MLRQLVLGAAALLLALTVPTAAGEASHRERVTLIRKATPNSNGVCCEKTQVTKGQPAGVPPLHWLLLMCQQQAHPASALT